MRSKGYRMSERTKFCAGGGQYTAVRQANRGLRRPLRNWRRQTLKPSNDHGSERGYGRARLVQQTHKKGGDYAVTGTSRHSGDGNPGKRRVLHGVRGCGGQKSGNQ